MLGINLTRPVATLAVVAGLLAVAGSASAAQTEEPIAPPHTELNLLGCEELVAKARHDIALNAIRADENPISITAAGTPGAGARIGVHAFSTPARTAPDLPVHTASDAAAA